MTSQRYLLEEAIIFRLLTPYLLGLLLTGWAGLTQAEENVPNIKFSIKPRLCVLSEGESLCEDLLEISWSSKQPRSLCLFQSDKSLPLRCWEEETFGKHSFALAIANNVQFDLREIDKNLLLVSQEFEVVQTTDNFRRRRRNPWSFF